MAHCKINRCGGTKKDGRRCKMCVRNGTLCRWHDQSGVKKDKKSKPEPKTNNAKNFVTVYDRYAYDPYDDELLDDTTRWKFTVKGGKIYDVKSSEDVFYFNEGLADLKTINELELLNKESPFKVSTDQKAIKEAELDERLKFVPVPFKSLIKTHLQH